MKHLIMVFIAFPAFAADFTLEREESNSKSTYVVKDGEVTLTTESKLTTATFVDTKEIDALLAVIRTTKDDKKPAGAKNRRACLVEGKTKRCSTVTGGTTPRLDALLKLEQVLLMHLFR